MKENNWISVNERLPKGDENDIPSDYSESVLAVTTTGIVVIGFYMFKKKRWLNNDFWFDATHWMPLPELPQPIDRGDQVLKEKVKT